MQHVESLWLRNNNSNRIDCLLNSFANNNRAQRAFLAIKQKRFNTIEKFKVCVIYQKLFKMPLIQMLLITSLTKWVENFVVAWTKDNIMSTSKKCRILRKLPGSINSLSELRCKGWIK